MNIKKCFLVLILFLFCSLSFSKEAEKKSTKETPPSNKSHVFSKIVFYIPNVLLDFVDIFKLNVGVGPGFGIHAQATEPLQAGIIFYDCVRIGLTGKRFDFWRYEDTQEIGICYAYHQKGDIKRNNSEIGGILHFLILGAEASINLEEIGDFISGIFFYDAKEDDLYFKK